MRQNLKDMFRQRPAETVVDFTLNGQTSLVIPCDSTIDRLLKLEYSLTASGTNEIYCRPNGDTSAVYNLVIQGSSVSSVPAQSNADTFSYHNSNGLYLSRLSFSAAGGGQGIVGQALIGLAPGMASGNGRLCKANVVVSSLVGSANEVADAYDIASSWQSNAVITQFTVVSSSAMTGWLRATRI